MNDKKPLEPYELADELVAAVKGPLLAWVLGGILAIFMAFIIGVLRWTYEGPAFGYRYETLSLLGVWLLCFWAVAFVLRLLSAKA
jgi:hypothetical protein